MLEKQKSIRRGYSAQNQYRQNSWDCKSYKNNNPSKSTFMLDKHFEEISTMYLKQTDIFKDLGIKEEDIIRERDKQLKGIDVIGHIDGNDVKIDIKAIASQLPTFCFEISGNKSSGQIGWLLKEDIETDYYLIVYHEVEGAIRNYSKGKRIMTVNNILNTEALLINKEKLKKAIEDEFQLPLQDIVQQIRNKDIEGKGVIRFDRYLNQVEKGGSIYPTLSLRVKECPINIVVKKEILKDIADKYWYIDEILKK